MLLTTDKHYTQSIPQDKTSLDQKMIISNIFLILLVVFWGLSATPAFAEDEDSGMEESTTFHVYDDVDLVSTLKFEYGIPRIVIKSVYPQLASETEHGGINRFNEIAMEIVKDEIANFRSRVKENSALQKKIPKKEVSNNLYIDYNTSYIKSKGDHIISIRISAQGYVSGLSHPYHRYQVFNYNLDKAQQIELSDLFLPQSNYLDVLSTYVSQTLSQRLKDTQRIAIGTAPILENFSNWNIKTNGLMFTFKESQVAPYMYGTQTVLVPYSALSGILSPESPIADCIEHRTRCLNNNLLTGGFIDEAANTKPSSRLLLSQR